MKDGETCVYCGEPATSIDHVIPRAYLNDIADVVGYENATTATVPACGDCNSRAGCNVFKSIIDKRAYILSRLERPAFQRILKRRDWTEAELDEFDWVLRADVLRGLAERDRLRRRLAFLKARVPAGHRIRLADAA